MMSDEDIQLRKLQMLMNAFNALKQSEDDEQDYFAELKRAAWNVLHENPGTEFGDWQHMLIKQYPAEVVDALGTNPPEVYAQLSDMWDCMDFEDEQTGECHTFQEWAEYFATDRSVELYDKLSEAKREISRFKRDKNAG